MREEKQEGKEEKDFTVAEKEKNMKILEKFAVVASG